LTVPRNVTTEVARLTERGSALGRRSGARADSSEMALFLVLNA
jgi:hypothetical protein